MQYLEVSFTLGKQVVNDVSGNFAKSILTMVNLQSPVYAVVKIQFCLHSLWTSASFVIPLDSRAVVKSAEPKKKKEIFWINQRVYLGRLCTVHSPGESATRQRPKPVQWGSPKP